MTGRDSAFDIIRSDKEGPFERLGDASSPDLALSSATSFVLRQFVQLPRLARLVRSGVQGSEDTSTTLEAAMLAKALFENPAWEFVDPYVARMTLPRRPVANNRYPEPVSSQTGFACVEEFILAMFHHSYWMLLCGLVQTVCAMPGVESSIHIDCESAERKDVEAAESIARCLDYTLDTASDSAPALRALLCHAPIQLSWGAWDRLSKREQTRSGDLLGGAVATPQAVRAAEMKEWCLCAAKRIQAIWHAGESSERDLRVVTEAFAGGQLIPAMLNRVRWSKT